MTLPVRTKGLLAAAVAGLTWSVLAIAIKVALQYVSSETIVWFRFCVALTTLLVLVCIFDRTQLRIFKKPPVLAILAGLCLAVNFFGYQKGVELTSPSNAQVGIQGAPLFLVLCGIFIFQEKLRPPQWIGFILSIVGLGIFFKDQLETSISQQSDFLDGNIWLAIASITWAGFASMQKILTRKGWRPQEINLILYLVAFIVLFPTADLKEFHELSAGTWAVLIYLGLNTLIAYGAMGIALELAPASQVSMVITCNPILTLIFMKILSFNNVDWIKPDQVSIFGYLGAALVIIGILLVVSLAPVQKANLNK